MESKETKTAKLWTQGARLILGVNGVPNYVFQISPDEWAGAAAAGNRIDIENVRKFYQSNPTNEADEAFFNITAEKQFLTTETDKQCAGKVVARLFNLHHSGEVYDTEPPPYEVHKYKVAHVFTDNGELIIYPTDKPDDILILVKGRAPNYTVVGWIYVIEAQEKDENHTWSRNVKNIPGTKFWCVPQEALHSMETLPAIEEDEESLNARKGLRFIGDNGLPNYKLKASPVELAGSVATGGLRRIECIRKRKKQEHYDDKDGQEWGTEAESCCAEKMMARHLNKHHSGEVFDGQPAEFDVDRVHVRYTPYENGNLIIYPENNPNHIFVLVTGKAPYYTLRGWCYGKDGLERGERKGAKSKSYWVPQDALNSMDTLPTELLE